MSPTIVVATIRRRPRGGCGVVDPREVFPRAYERLSIRRQSRLPPRARHRLEFFRSDGLRDHRRVLRDSIFVFSSRAASLERLFERLGEEWRIPRECVRRGDDRFARHGRAVHLADLAEEREELVGVPLDGGDRVIVERESLKSGRGGDVKRGPQGRRARHVAHAIEGDVEDGEMRGAAEISDPPHAVLARVEIREARKPKIRNLLETITVQAQLAERRVPPPGGQAPDPNPSRRLRKLSGKRTILLSVATRTLRSGHRSRPSRYTTRASDTFNLSKFGNSDFSVSVETPARRADSPPNATP